MSPHTEMSPEELDQFLVCARVGHLGIIIEEEPYIFPVGFAYTDRKIIIHTCGTGLKMRGLNENPNVCFEVDESISDGSMYKSVIIFGSAKILSDEKMMIPYLQALIDKYRVSEDFEDYMRKPKRKRDQELKAVRIIVISPTKITSRKFNKFDMKA